MDQDTLAVIERLEQALRTSGLSLRRFATSLGTSPSRFSAYCAGRTAPSAAFLIRAERIAAGLAGARAAGFPSSIDAVESIRRADRQGDEDWTYALALEARDRLRDLLGRRPDLVTAWEAQPTPRRDRWYALVAAFVQREFELAGLGTPEWTRGPRLDVAWILDTPRLSTSEIRRQTPAWLADRNIYIAEKDLATA